MYDDTWVGSLQDGSLFEEDDESKSLIEKEEAGDVDETWPLVIFVPVFFERVVYCESGTFVLIDNRTFRWKGKRGEVLKPSDPACICFFVFVKSWEKDERLW